MKSNPAVSNQHSESGCCANHDDASSVDFRLPAGWLRHRMVWSVAAALGVIGFYLGLITLTSNWSNAAYQFSEYGNFHHFFNQQLPTEAVMTQHTYSIPNISCGHCVAAITNELKEIEGVKQISGDPQVKTITLELESPATDEQIKAKLEAIGYPVA